MKQTQHINKLVFFPPFVLLGATILISLFSPNYFNTLVNNANDFVLHNFGWLFSWSSFLFLVILVGVYFSPLGAIIIGGPDAQPILKKSRWFAISVCTTIATGILFWGCAEPLYHFSSPPNGLEIEAYSKEAKIFSLSTMYMHWSFTPYGIYCITGLLFALVYYNRKEAFAVSSLLSPIIPHSILHSRKKYFVDIICLYALVLGMSASLGAGILAISGGLDQNFGITKSNLIIGIIGFVIITSFLISAISGLHKGIKWLSSINIIFFIVLASFVFIFSDPLSIIELSSVSLIDYIQNFFQRSLNVSSHIEQEWLFDWSIFYWANWFAWAPIASLFLGKLAKGYNVRTYIRFNLIYPSIFAILWMSIFSGGTLLKDQMDKSLSSLMQTNGEESVMYALLEALPLGGLLSIFSVFIIFISYVTAADSNISAMSEMSIENTEEAKDSNSFVIKLVWGVIIGLLTFVMLASDGIDGIRKLSVLGGFPALVIIILVAMGLVRYIFQPQLLRGEKE